MRIGQFWARGDYTGDFTVTLLSNLTGDVFTSATVSGPSTADSWTQFNFTLTPAEAAPNSNNSLSVTFDASQASAGSLDFNLISLFPPTYNNRPNGLRPDIMQILSEQPPSFLRFPGGNNLEGSKYALDVYPLSLANRIEQTTFPTVSLGIKPLVL